MGRVLFWVTRVCLFTQLIEVDRLGSGIRVSARFQIFALTAGWGGGIVATEELTGVIRSGEMFYRPMLV